jgi:hypothetical protein
MSTADRLIAQGRVEGRVEGQANSLLRLLEARFGALPDDVRGRVRSAAIEDLDRWTVRVLDAKSLADVFRASR